jgi:tRNA pseudouridine38-40 synthase
MRIAAGIEYDGSGYFGWQRQTFEKLPTIQETLEKAISNVAAQNIHIIAAGRTDAGVHATGQIIHFDTASQRTAREWVFGSNAYLPKDIRVQWAKPVPDTFQARFSAIARRYQYLIYNSPIRSAIMHNKAAMIYKLLDADKMHRAAQYFVGEKDFTSFRALSCQAKSPVRKLAYFTVQRVGSWVTLEVQANAFLHHMVRNMAGLLIDIGLSKKPVECVPEILALKNRAQASVTAPAEGLYLVKVIYPEVFGVP